MNILITGGASGLGEAVTRSLAAKKEHFVFFTFCASKGKALEIEEEFKNSKAIRCDFKDTDSVSELVGQLAGFSLDVLVNSATTGIIRNHFHKINPPEFAASFKDNVLPVIQITQEAIRHFRKKKFGKIVTILSSFIINKPPVGMSEYTANKNYLFSLTKSWAAENANFNITSNCISPAFMQTALTSDTDERIVEKMIAAHPLNRLLTISEVAEAVEYFVNCSQQINGSNLVINAASDID
jgi:3-oxoacyl-[acyl-carrier protein] reductase